MKIILLTGHCVPLKDVDKKITQRLIKRAAKQELEAIKYEDWLYIGHVQRIDIEPDDPPQRLATIYAPSTFYGELHRAGLFSHEVRISYGQYMMIKKSA